MRVYRVETRKNLRMGNVGYGPYMPDWDAIGEDDLGNDSTDIAFHYAAHSTCTPKEHLRPGPQRDGFLHHEVSLHQHYVFGFHTYAKAARWWKPVLMECLNQDLGFPKHFGLSVYYVPDSMVLLPRKKNPNQIMFSAHAAKLLLVESLEVMAHLY